MLGQVVSRSSGPVQLEGGRRMLDRSTVSMPGQVLQSGKIEEKEGLMLYMQDLCLICVAICMVYNRCYRCMHDFAYML